MYLGAAVELAVAVTVVATMRDIRSTILAGDPGYTGAQWRAEVSSTFVPLVVAAVLAVGFWAWMAWANGRRYRWARVLFALFFGLNTHSLLHGLAGGGGDLRPAGPWSRPRSSGVSSSLSSFWSCASRSGHSSPPGRLGARLRPRVIRSSAVYAAIMSQARRLASPTGEGGPALTAVHLSKRFGDRAAFDDVSFEVGRGEVFGLLGPNGAGKTTTVRTFGTLVAPTSGSATVAGLPLRSENGVEIRRRISIMPESPGLYLRLSVHENLRFFAGLYELPDAGNRIDRALRAVNLAERRNDACGVLSKGLRQRVSLARALLNEPQVLFLDEPTSGLDPVAAREVHELIDRLRRSGVSIFLTTHRLNEAERLCDRVAILNTSLRTIGRPDELRDRLFAKTLTVRTRDPLAQPDHVFADLPAVDGWHADGPTTYVLTVSDATVAAPAATRALVAADADLLSISQSHHSLEDVYLTLIDDDKAANRA